MKHASLLIALCVLFSLSAVAQSAAPAEKTTQRITITTTKVDENGKSITETYIAEGEEPAKILSEMAINPEIIQEVRIEGDLDKSKEERLFLFRSAGDNVVIEGTLNENVDQDQPVEVIISKTDDGSGKHTYQKISTWHGNTNKAGGHAFVTVGEKKANCAALGVFTDSYSDIYGAKVNKLIDKGAAQEAGLQEGDIIKSIDEFDVSDYSTLVFALSHYRPGDKVIVRYEREGKSLKANATLKDWAAMPGFEYKARTDCGQSELPADSDQEKPFIDQPNNVPDIQPLDLTDARIYPNPSDGLFSFSFTTKPGPLTVSVSDANGKVVFRDRNSNTSGTYNREIDIKDMPQGNYIITVSQDDKVFTQQIAKQ